MLPSNKIAPTQVRCCKILEKSIRHSFLSTVFIQTIHSTASNLNASDMYLYMRIAKLHAFTLKSQLLFLPRIREKS